MKTFKLTMRVATGIAGLATIFAAAFPLTASAARLSISKTGEGTVTSAPAGIACGSTCSARFSSGIKVTLTAQAATGYEFSSWSANCPSGSLTIDAVNRRPVCTANFKVKPIITPPPAVTYNLYVTPLGTGTGVVKSAPTGITCGSTCQASYAANTSVVLSAVANTGSAFAGWSGLCSGTAASSTVLLNASGTCNATFNLVSTPPPPPPPPAPVSGAPMVLYTDITSGPNTGGENDKGIYLSVFGKNFGTTGLGSTVKVFINDIEVDNYRYLGASRGRSDIDQVTVQIGAIGFPVPGVKLPIKVVVNGVVSNLDQTFTVNPGNIYFIDPVSGVDTTSTTTGGGITTPFRTVQKASGLTLSFGIKSTVDAGVWGRVRAGDFVVLRGGTYTDVGFGGSASGEGYFVQTLNKSGCPVATNCAQGGGLSSGPITFMGFPTETAFINRPNSGAGVSGGGFTSADSARQGSGYGAWFNIVNLKIESGFADGPINTQRAELNPLGANWRVVNNELTGYSCANTTLCRGGTIAGSGIGNVWLGNYGHDFYDKPDANTSLENHGIYIGGGGTYEIAYNHFAKILGGSGIQVQSFYQSVTSLNIHHNVIHDIGKHGLNFAAGVGNNVVVWNNIIYDTDYAGARFQDDTLRNLKLYNNTFYNIGRLGSPASSAALTNDTNVAAGMFEVRNNIFWVNPAGIYISGCCNGSFSGGAIAASNNLWFGAGAPPAFDVAPQNANPSFVAPGTNFRLNTGSAAIDRGTNLVSAWVKNDADITKLRPANSSFDIGAYEK